MAATILTYHAIDAAASADPGNSYVTLTHDLRRHFEWLASRPGSVARLSEVVDSLRTRQALSSSKVAITLDDGLACCHDHFLPLLQEFALPATIFVVADRIGRHNDWDADGGAVRRRMITATELRSLCDAGVEIGSHGLSHLRLAHVDTAQMREEVHASKAMLEDIIGQPVSHFAYPYGSYSAAVVDEVQAAGYQAAVTSDIGRNEPGVSLFLLRRAGMKRGDGLPRLASKVMLGADVQHGFKRWIKDRLGRH